MKSILLVALITTIQMNAIAQRDNVRLNTNSYFSLPAMALIQSKAAVKYGYANGPEKDHDFYIHRSRTFRITGLSLLGAGVIFGVAGLLVSTNTTTPDNYNTRDQTIETLFTTSAATGIASIPFMILAHACKSKANKLSMTNQKTSFNIPGKPEKNIISLSVSIPLGK